MVRRLSVLFVILALLGFGVAGAAEPSVDEYVTIFNPDLFAGKDAAPMTSTFTVPSSDISHEVKDMFWFTMLVFLPFLILPQILLLVVIFKFRQRADGRKAATWVHNSKLEVFWTAIPIAALIIVGIPVFPLLFKMELPPDNINDAVQITVNGRQFAWDYTYKHEDIALGLDLVSAQQESIVLPIGRTVSLAITSNDVNHAWWIPAFGVKKDAIIGRYNSAWFTPDRIGFYKGQCAELCGALHGQMIIGAVVVEPQHYELWLSLQRHREAATPVWNAVMAWKTGADETPVRDAIIRYREKTKATSEADFALHYWIAHNSESLRRRDPGGLKDSDAYQAWQADLDPATISSRKQLVGRILAASVSAIYQPEVVVTASNQE